MLPKLDFFLCIDCGSNGKPRRIFHFLFVVFWSKKRRQEEEEKKQNKRETKEKLGGGLSEEIHTNECKNDLFFFPFFFFFCFFFFFFVLLGRFEFGCCCVVLSTGTLSVFRFVWFCFGTSSLFVSLVEWCFSLSFSFSKLVTNFLPSLLERPLPFFLLNSRALVG